MDITDIKVVRATARDAALLADLGATTFRDTFGPDNTQADMDLYLASSFSPQQQALELADETSVFLIARGEGEALGYARLRFGAWRDCVGGGRPVEIARLYADRQWIGRGIGATLMMSAFDLASDAGCDVVWLDVWEKNTRAIEFYEKWGFTIVGSQAFILGDDVQNDLLMARVIVQPEHQWEVDR